MDEPRPPACGGCEYSHVCEADRENGQKYDYCPKWKHAVGREDTLALMESMERLYQKRDHNGTLNPAEQAELKDLNKRWAIANKLIVKEEPTPEAKEKSTRSRNNKRRGKYHEKVVAKKLGGRADGRVGQKDVAAGPFRVEVKSMAAIPARLKRDWMQATRLAGTKCPVLVYVDTSDRQKLAIMDFGDFTDWHGKLDKPAKV